MDCDATELHAYVELKPFSQWCARTEQNDTAILMVSILRVVFSQASVEFCLY